MNSDFKDLLQIFAEEEVEYLIIGAYAVMNYTQPRYTKEIDLWIKPDVENSHRVARAFARFGVPLIEVTREDFAEEGLQYVIGVSPCQIDFLTTMPGAISFEDSWCKRETNKTKEGFAIHYLGKADLITAKKLPGVPRISPISTNYAAPTHSPKNSAPPRLWMRHNKDVFKIHHWKFDVRRPSRHPQPTRPSVIRLTIAKRLRSMGFPARSHFSPTNQVPTKSWPCEKIQDFENELSKSKSLL
jgi:hypothetical protein